MSAPVAPPEVVARASALYARHHRAWVADPTEPAALDIPLRVPTERDVLTDIEGAIAWISAWRDAASLWPATVTWETRRWSRVGEQTVPTRVRIDGAWAITRVAGQQEAFGLLARRCEELRRVLGDGDAVVAALRRHAGQIAMLDEHDFDVLGGVVGWLAANPTSGRYARELPIVGVDSKWIERRRAMVEALVSAVTGRTSLGLAEPPRLLRMRSLDPAWDFGGVADVSVRVGDAAALHVPLQTAIVTENLQTFLALPERPGTLAIHGGGYAVDALEAVPWLSAMRVLYWGDLDSDGFAIVNRARAHDIDLETVLMDGETLMAHRDLWVPEPDRTRRELPFLSVAEQDAYEALRREGWPRLEQERVAWAYALEVIDRVLSQR
ncbi:MAG: Wadjet anti-phage system protein JetD domain-containing protein [Demequina sp.]